MRRDGGCHNRATMPAAHRRARVATAGAVVALLIHFGTAAAGEGQATPGDEGTLQGLLEKMNIRARPTQMPDFVEATRPDPTTLHFLPTGQPHPKRPVAVKSAAEVKAAEAKLDAARASQLNPPAPAPAVAAPAAPTPDPVKPTRPKPTREPQ